MANPISHLPHVRNVQAGVNKWDPMHNAIFEVYFALPTALIEAGFKQEEAILTEQVKEVSGLDALQKVPAAGSQKFFGAEVSFLNPTLESTSAEITVTFNLNLRHNNDAYVFKVIKAWGKLGYDLADGTRTLKRDYCADNLRIAQANRNGEIFRSIIFHDVLLTQIQGAESLSYENNEPVTIQVTFRSDYWDESLM